MNTYDFLKKIELYFPFDGSETKFNKIIMAYAEVIQAEIFKNGKTYDFDRIIKALVKNYKYKSFPSLAEIINYLPEGITVKESLSGKEGQTIKRTLNGVEYEFTIVPNHWEKIKTIEELDRDIYFRTQKEE